MLVVHALLSLGDFFAATPGIQELKESACKLTPVSNKFDGSGYEFMYGMFLLPLRALPSPPKVLEIGLGCTMGYGPGASAKTWRAVLPTADIWEAEYDAGCVAKYRSEVN